MNTNDKEFLVHKIRTQYTEKTTSELDELRELDAKVKRPANIFGYVFGSISAIVMGSGMSLVMTDIGNVIGMSEAFVPGLIIGIIGLCMSLSTYPIYKAILNARKKKYAKQVIQLTDKILK